MPGRDITPPGLSLLFLFIFWSPGGGLTYHMLSHDEVSLQVHGNGANYLQTGTSETTRKKESSISKQACSDYLVTAMKNSHMPSIYSCRQNVLTLPKGPKVLPHHSILHLSTAPSKSSPVRSRQVTLLRCGCLNECLSFFLLNAVAIKYSDKSNLRKKRLTLVHCSRFSPS